jgi:sec-independent protein translocase protein TatA
MVGDILQPTHLLFVLVVALLVLGPKRLPEVGQKLGSGIRDFRNALNGESPEPRREERPEPEYVQAPPDPPLPGARTESAEPAPAVGAHRAEPETAASTAGGDTEPATTAQPAATAEPRA